MDENQPGRPTVVVVGGGYGGVNVAQALDEDLEVVLVEPKDAFVHNVGALRGLVEPAFLPRIFLPYGGLLAHGRVVRDRAVEVSPHRVVLASGDAISADYIVLASGSTYPFPAKSDAHDAEDAIDNYRAAYDELTHANRVLLVGAGAVGIELAGEIVSKWPDKHVTILDLADDVLGDRFRPDLRAELRTQLVALGVELVLGEGLREFPPTSANEFATFTVTTNSGRLITADIWFQCFGVTPISDYLSADLAAARSPDGFVTVGPALQVAGHENVFAIGDVSAADAKMAGIAGRQAQLVAANILKMVNGDDDLAAYEPFGTAIVVPIGPEGGSGRAPWPRRACLARDGRERQRPRPHGRPVRGDPGPHHRRFRLSSPLPRVTQRTCSSGVFASAKLLRGVDDGAGEGDEHVVAVDDRIETRRGAAGEIGAQR